MTTPINFELAKLLKEKGFDRKCVSFYDLISNQQIDNATSGNYNLTKQSVSIPTIAEVVMWCFNKYKYSIEYSMNISESGEYDGCYVFNGLIKGSEDYKLKIFYTSKDYPTVEKALEDAINHFLVNFC